MKLFNKLMNLIRRLKNSDNRVFSEEDFKLINEEKEGLIRLHPHTSMPFLNYDMAISVFNEITGGNYDVEILKNETDIKNDIFKVFGRLTIRKNGVTRVIEGYGSATIMRSRKDGKIANIDYQKAAVNDFMKSMLLKQIGIGRVQYIRAKEEMMNRGSRRIVN